MSKLPSDATLDIINKLAGGGWSGTVKVSVDAEWPEGAARSYVSYAPVPVFGHGCGPGSHGTPEATDPDISTARCANRKCLDDVDFDALPEVDFSNTQKEALLETARKADVYGVPDLKDKFTQYLIDAFGAIDFDVLDQVDYSNAQRDALRIDVRGGGGGSGGGGGRG